MTLYKKMLATGFIAIALMGCGDKEEEVVKLRSVRYITVELESPGEALSFTGDIRAASEPEVSFRVSGNIEKMKYKLGENVKKGDILATLDKTDYQIKVRKAESSYETAKAGKVEAQSSYNRIKELYQNDSVSKSEFESAKAKVDSAVANLKVAEEEVKYARTQLGYTILKSSIDGTIAVKAAEVNENVGAGQPVYILNSDKDLEAVSFVPENVIGQIQKGKTVKVLVEALKKTYEGEVVEVATSSAQYGSTFPVKVSIKNAEKELRSGMSVVVNFNDKIVKERTKIFIPLHVVIEENNEKFVYVMEKSNEGENVGVVKKAAITVGDITNRGIEVLSGLNAGDKVITAGMTKLSQGVEVKYN